ncbi:MAG TPA: ABC transporter substrate-binding protein [Acidimicrobiales bacterium]|nr:ABC transporter substrate-binding protein [Acidimicrobiales bacterium]
MRTKRCWVGLAAAVLLVSACGTTVKGVDGLSPRALEELTTQEGGPADDFAGSGPAGTGPTATAGPGASAAATEAAKKAAEAAAQRGRLATGTGITPTTITVGITWLDITALFAAFAPTARNEAKATSKEAAQAVVDWMNKNGGIAGRKIVPIYHEYPVHAAAQASTRSQAEQSTCDAFTQDAKAFAALPLFSSEGIFNTCAAKRKMISTVIGNLDEIMDKKRTAELGAYWYRLDGMGGERREEVTVAQLQRRGFFAPGSKVGLLITDTPTARRLSEQVLEPALARIGANVVEKAYYFDDQNLSTTVLRFQTLGIDRIMWGNCFSCQVSVANFMATAQNQDYDPVYGLTTQNTIGALRTLGAPKEQLVNAVAFGWKPGTDLATNNVEPPRPGPQATCRQAIVEAGMGNDFPPGYEGVYEAICEQLFFLKRGLEAAPSLTAEGLRQVVESQGPQPGVGTFRVHFTKDRHDGVVAVRDLYFGAQCDCWSYRGPEHAATG